MGTAKGLVAERATEAAEAAQTSTAVSVGRLWTDPEGDVHERMPETRNQARCGITMEFESGSHATPSRRGCPDCVKQAIEEYARNHNCKDAGCGANTAFHY